MHQLKVTILKDGKAFLDGAFDVTEEDYTVVVDLMKEVQMAREEAASLLSGYMHAKDIGPVTEDMGKLAMFATVYMLESGETDIEIPLKIGADKQDQ